MPIQKFPNAYEININQKNNSLEFTTEFGLVYEIYTQPGNKIIPGFIFTSNITYFGFFAKGKSCPDEKVIPTIMNVLIDLLEDSNAVVAFLHSGTNGKDKAREKYFQRLFSKYGAADLYKTDFKLAPGDGTASIIYRPDNINLNALRNLSSEEIIARMESKDQFDDYYN